MQEKQKLKYLELQNNAEYIKMVIGQDERERARQKADDRKAL